MTRPPLPPSSPFGDDTEEALSALVDGELAAFAADHGITEADARARLEQWPEYPARLAALERGRAAVSEPVAPLDDITRRRLIRNALPAADGTGTTSTRQGWSWLRISAAAAAALIVLAGIGAMLTSLGTGDDTKSSSSTGGSVAAAPEAPRGDLGSLGDVTDPTAIRDLLDPGASEKSAAPSTNTEPRVDEQRNSASDAPQDSAGTAAGDGSGLQFDAGAPTPQACAAEELAGRRPVRFFATGTYRGQQVTIIGVDSGGRTIAFVVPDTDCTNVLTAISR